VRCTVAEREGGRWRVSIESELSGGQSVVYATIVVNAAGAQAAEVHNHVVHSDRPIKVRFTKTTHVVVRPQTPLTAGYALATGGGRFAYAVPWRDGTMLVGPARRSVNTGASHDVERQDVAALADTVAQYFDAPISADQIVLAFTAVASMPAEAPRRDEHAILVEAPPRGAPLISVFGGTLAGHRGFAEQIVDTLRRFRPVSAPWTARAALPGGGFPGSGRVDLVRALRAAYPFLSEAHGWRLVEAYGTRASSILTGARAPSDLGTRFGADLTEAEVNYLRSEEWALTAEDVLWRRSKLGLVFSESEAAVLAAWMADKALAGAPA
jgi:glycerol-3-phosphate dehydrogenase